MTPATPTPGQAAAGDPQRKTERFPHRAAFSFLTPAGVTGTTVDIGAGGVGVQLAQALAPGTNVELTIFGGRAIAQGKVRWCRAEGGAYRAGIQFAAEDWSIIALVRAHLGQAP
jgi:hypothetical protein